MFCYAPSKRKIYGKCFFKISMHPFLFICTFKIKYNCTFIPFKVKYNKTFHHKCWKILF